jgi:hypothetical protein
MFAETLDYFQYSTTRVIPEKPRLLFLSFSLCLASLRVQSAARVALRQVPQK